MDGIYFYFVNKHLSSWPLLGLKLFTKLQNFGLDVIENICRKQNYCSYRDDFCLEKGKRHCVKRRKCWLFSAFPTMY